MKIKKNKYFIFSLIIFFLSILVLVSAFLLNQSLTLDKKEVPTILKVGKITAFNLDNSTFSLGTITTGATSSRSFQIENNYPFSIVAHISSKGNISQFLIFERKIQITPREKKIINIGTILPMEEDYGDYSGKIIIVLKRKI